MEGGYNGVAKAKNQDKKTSDEYKTVKKVNKSSSDILKTMYKNARARRVDVGRRRPQQVEMRMAEPDRLLLCCSGVVGVTALLPANLCKRTEYNMALDIWTLLGS